MERFGLERGGRGYRCDGGELGIWTPQSGLLLVRIVGHGKAEFAAPIIEEYERLRGTGRRVHLFGDFGRMANYDSLLRVRCTEHFRANLSGFEAIQVYVESELVTMAIAVANVALNGIITTHTSMASFRRAIDHQMALHDVTDFSSDVFAP